MRKLVVAVSAVAMVALGASAAQAQATQRCPSPEDIKFEAPFQVGDIEGGIEITAIAGESITFEIPTGFVVDAICVKAGRTATTITAFDADGSTTQGNFRIDSNCTVKDIEPDGDTDLWAETGSCTVTVTRLGGPGTSHITFYGDFYTAPEAAVAPLVLSQSQGSSAAPAAGGLAFTGAQISIMLVILVGLIVAGTLAWTAGRRRAAKTD